MIILLWAPKPYSNYSGPYKINPKPRQVLVGGAEPLGGPMGVALAPDGGLIVVDTEPWLRLHDFGLRVYGFSPKP